MSGMTAGGVPEGATRELERRPRRLPVAIIALVVLSVLIYFGFTMFASSVVYYRTPTEVLAQPGARVRLSGKVVPGSIETDVGAGTVSFVVSDGKSSVPVFYRGPAPDTLKDEAQAVAEGSLGDDGVFRAVTLFAKCPSKFESKTEGG